MAMVISKTPLRMSFVGGGTDLPAFSDEHGGAVLSTAIDKWVRVGRRAPLRGRRPGELLADRDRRQGGRPRARADSGGDAPHRASPAASR